MSRKQRLLTAEERERYLLGGGVTCPFCGSEDLLGCEEDVLPGKFWQRIVCQDCGRSWRDIYALEAIEEE